MKESSKESKMQKCDELQKIEDLMQRFEAAAQNDGDIQYWSARDLQTLLGYRQWREFIKVIERAKEACENSDHVINDHFADARKMVEIGSNSARQVEDYHLDRYACYLIAQNGDSRKKEIAAAQTYFAIQTRRQELADKEDSDSDFKNLSENQRRLYLRNEIVEGNKKLASAAKKSGVKTGPEFARFQNAGYKGLYNGSGAQQIREKRKLPKNGQILDYMGPTELAANLFRVTQTEEKLKKDNIKGKAAANKTHYEIGKEVRASMQRISGIMPENLPVYEDVQKVAQAERKAQIAHSSSQQTALTGNVQRAKSQIAVKIDLKKDLQPYCLLIMASEENGEATIARLLEELPKYIDLPKDILEPLAGRKDSKLSQRVRNIKSHRNSSHNMLKLGYAEEFRGGLRITEKGRVYIDKYFKPIK